MKKAIILLLLIFLIPLALAKTETTKVLHFNETVTVYGKTLTTLGANPDGRIKVGVDGVQGIVRGINRTLNINEMWVNMLNFTYVDSESFDVIFELRVDFECGDKSCNSSETSISCCTDCGCEGNLKCISNICQKEECVINPDCDDDNSCTVDKCSGSPKSCSNTLIALCVNGDACCPESCDAEKDSDCKAETVEEVKEEVEEETQDVGPVVEESQQVPEQKKFIRTEKEKGILIMAGVALLVIIIGFFIFGRK